MYRVWNRILLSSLRLFPAGVAFPIYRPWPATYGVGAVYNPSTGGWAAGRAAYGPYGAAGSSAWYNPSTGRYGRSASVQGWNGSRTVANAYNPWTGYGATSRAHNAYGQWVSSVATRGEQWAKSAHVTTAQGTRFAYKNSSGQAGTGFHGANGTVANTTNGVYVGHDGNVYRKNGDGSWSRYNQGNWNQVDSTAAKQQAQQNFQSKHPSSGSQPVGAASPASQTTREPVGSVRTQPSGGATGAPHPTKGATASPDTVQGLNNSAQSPSTKPATNPAIPKYPHLETEYVLGSIASVGSKFRESKAAQPTRSC